MFLKTYVDVPVSLDSFKETFSWEPERCFGGLGENARDEGERLLTEAGLSSDPESGCSARLLVGGVLVQEHLVTVPVELGVQGGGRFPSLTGTIEAAWLGPQRAYVSLSLQYEVPVDLIERTLQRTVYHRVIEVAMQHLLMSVAECLCVSCSVNPTYTWSGGTTASG